jgi:hypothetical protein
MCISERILSCVEKNHFLMAILLFRYVFTKFFFNLRSLCLISERDLRLCVMSVFSCVLKKQQLLFFG